MAILTKVTEPKATSNGGQHMSLWFAEDSFGAPCHRSLFADEKGNWERASAEKFTAAVGKNLPIAGIVVLSHAPQEFTAADGRVVTKTSTRVVKFRDESWTRCLSLYDVPMEDEVIDEDTGSVVFAPPVEVTEGEEVTSEGEMPF